MTLAEELQKLDPETRAYVLVGRFMQRWNSVEYRLRTVIGKALGIDPKMTMIITANMALSDRIYTARTIIDVSAMREDERKHFNKLLIDVARYSETRNAIVHNLFFPMEEGDGVSFYIFKAKGKYEVPDMDWTVADFETAYHTILQFSLELTKLQERIATASLAEALQKVQPSRPSVFGGMFGMPHGLGQPGLLSDYLAATAERRSDEGAAGSSGSPHGA